MNIMTGYLGATEGEVLIDGHNILEEPEQAKKCMGYLPEVPPLYTDMTVYEYLVPTKLQIGKEVILSEETKGYIVGYPGVVHGRNWDDARDYLWPIPAAQRTLNPALTQNPGWDDGLNF